MTAGCTAAQIRDSARQIIGMCCPRTDWRLSCCCRVMSKLVLTQPVLGELYAFGNENQAPVRVSAQILEHVVPAACPSVLDTTCTPSQFLASMSIVKCGVWCKVSHIMNCER